MGSRYLLFLLEDISTFELGNDSEGKTNLESYCHLTSLLLNCFSKCYGQVTNLGNSAFYTVVCPNSSCLGTWVSINNKTYIDTIQSQINQRLEQRTVVSKEPEDLIPYRKIYDAIMQLKLKLSPTDVMDVIWVLPNLERKGKFQMSMEADTNTAPFLYRSLTSLHDFSSFVQITLLSAYSNNNLSIWSKLLHASVYYVPSFAIPHEPLSKDITFSQAVTSSLIIETPLERQIQKQSEKPVRLPPIVNQNQFEVSPAEMEIVCFRLIAMNIESRCRFEWREINHQFTPSLFEKDTMVGSKHSAIVSAIKVTKSSALDLTVDSSIQLLNQWTSLEMIQHFHLFLQCCVEYSIILTHPIKNPFQSLFTSGCAYYSCHILQPSTKSKPSSSIGLLTVSTTSVSLFILPSDSAALTPLQYILYQAIHQPSSHVILDSDMDSALLQARIINTDQEEEQALFELPSQQPYISYDLTQFSHPVELDPTIKYHNQSVHLWREEELLKTISNLTVRDNDLWKQRLFGDESTKQQANKKQKKRKPIQPLQPASTSRIPQNAYDLTRCFINTGESAIDTDFFDFQPLSVPALPASFPSNCCRSDQFKSISINDTCESVLFACCGEDYWDEQNANEEVKIHGMLQRVDPYATFILSSMQTKKRQRKERSSLDMNNDLLERAVNNTILSILPSQYNNSAMYEKVWNLSMSLCQTVLDTLYDIHRSVLPSSLFAKEARKHVSYVVSCLLPNESMERSRTSKRSRLSDIASFMDASPYSRNEAGQTPDTSLLGTPSSLGTALGLESKRQRYLPTLPQAPTPETNLVNFE